MLLPQLKKVATVATLSNLTLSANHNSAEFRLTCLAAFVSVTPSASDENLYLNKGFSFFYPPPVGLRACVSLHVSNVQHEMSVSDSSQ